MADSRRKTISSSQSGIPVPASANRPSSRQSMAHSQQPPNHINNSRLSLAPGRSLPASRGSLAPSTSHTQLDQLQQSQRQADSAGGSQGSQMFSQGHGGPTAPSTASRVNMYTSQGAMSASRNTVMRSGGQERQEYAPPSCVVVFLVSRSRNTRD